MLRFGNFQSPFRRGNGCYTRYHRAAAVIETFQSPFRRGNGCYFASGFVIASYWSSFSPLFVGAMVATFHFARRVGRRLLSVPFSSGQWLLHITEQIG